MTEPNPFDVEIPQPLAMFNHTIVHPENMEVVQGDNRARKLTKAQLKIIRRKHKELEKILASYDYDSQKRRLDDLKQQWTSMKIDLYNLKNNETYDPVEVQRITRQMSHVKRDVQTIRNALKPAKYAAAQMQRIAQRLQEHEIAIANESLYIRLRKDMAREANIFAEIIIDTWTRLGYSYEYSHKGKTKRRKVRFEEIVATEDELQLKIKVNSLTLLESTRHHLPYGVRVAHLVSDETLNELSAACERQVTSPHIDEGFDFRNGAWLVVHRLGLTDGLFNYVTLEAVLKKYQHNKRHKIPLPLGVKRGRKINWVYLNEHPHIMFNGQSGTGKSRAIATVCCTLVQFHSPDEIRLVLVDLKRGGDLNPFEDTPHALCPVVKHVEHLDEILAQLRTLMHWRMDEISQIAVDIDGYNNQVPEERRMPRILVVIDEYTAIYLDKERARNINHNATILATQARAAGIHLCIGNQQPYADAVPKQVKSNISIIISGRQMTMGGSMSTFGSGQATKIPKIPGRMVVNDGMDTYQVQMPHAREQDVKRAVEAAANWPQGHPFELPNFENAENVIEMPRFGQAEFIAIAIEEMNGVISPRRIFERGGSNLSLGKLQGISRQIIKTGRVTYNNEEYHVIPYGKGYQLKKEQSRGNIVNTSITGD